MRSLAFALLMMSLVPYALIRPYVGLLLWVWISFMNPHRLTYGFAYSFPWVQIVAIVTIIALLASKEEKRKWIPSSGFSWLLFAFFTWTVVTTLFAFNREAAITELIKFSKIQVMLFMMLILLNDRRRLHWIVWVIAMSIAFYGIKGGLFTLIRGGNFKVLGPAGSFIAGTNELAAALVMIIPLLRYLQLQSKSKWIRHGLSGAIFLCVVATFGTYSRGGLIALLVVGAMLILKTRRRFLFLILLAAIVIPAVQFMPPAWVARMGTIHDYKKVSSAESRIESWKTATNIALARPVLGGGFDAGVDPEVFARFASSGARRPRAIHSIFFQVLGDQGFVGLTLFLAMIGLSWRNGSRVRAITKRSDEDRWAFDLASMLQVSLVGYLAAGITMPLSYHDVPYALMELLASLWLMKGTFAAKSTAAVATAPRMQRSQAVPTPVLPRTRS